MQDFFAVSIGAANVAFATGTEDIAGDYENLLLLKQLFNKSMLERPVSLMQGKT